MVWSLLQTSPSSARAFRMLRRAIKGRVVSRTPPGITGLHVTFMIGLRGDAVLAFALAAMVGDEVACSGSL
jgi:hypothetical protein